MLKTKKGCSRDRFARKRMSAVKQKNTTDKTVKSIRANVGVVLGDQTRPVLLVRQRRQATMTTRGYLKSIGSLINVKKTDNSNNYRS